MKKMNAEIMNVIKNEDERGEHEWKAYSLKEAKQLLADAISYQKYWNEQVKDDTWKSRHSKEREQYNLWVGLFTHTTMQIGLRKAQKLTTEMWKNAEQELERPHLIGGRVYLEVGVSQYRNSFHVRTEGTKHINQDIFDQCDALKEKLFAEKRGEEE